MSILDNLNDEQKAAITHREGPLLIVAGAGTGKTTVITKRIAWLIEQNLSKTDEILALTFTDKAAQEMSERVDILLPYGYVDVWISTFHAFCDKILKDHGIDIGIPSNFQLLDETAQWLLVRRNLHRFSLDYYRPRGNPAKFIHALLQHFSRCKDEMITPEAYLSYGEKLFLDEDNAFVGKERNTDESNALEIKRVNEVARAYSTYQNLLLEENCLDFGDLIVFAIELLQKRPNLLALYREKLSHILVDEFQDTNLAQYELVKILSRPREHITVVGDDDQSIYKFRGASVSNILRFIEDFPQAKKVFLTKNYRSRQNILDFTYKFIVQNNPDRLEVKFSDENLSKRLIASSSDAGVIEHLHAENGEAEVEQVVSKIEELYARSETPNWNDFAILTRSNDAAQPFVEYLSSKQIPNIFLAHKGLFQKPVILDVINFFNAVVHPWDDRSLYRLMTLPMLKIPEAEILQMTHFAKKKACSLFDLCRASPAGLGISDATRTSLQAILRWIERGQGMMNKGNIREIFLTMMAESQYLQWINKLSDSEAIKIYHSLNAFDQFIKNFFHAHEAPLLKDFIEEFDYLREAGESGALSSSFDEGPEAVKILTIHTAKGLEFRYVFLVNLVDKRFPSIERSEGIPIPDALLHEHLSEGDYHLQEERRLFYVACTRAKEHLYFSSAEDYGGARTKKLSRFLQECGFVLTDMPEQKQKKRIGLPPPKPISPAMHPLQKENTLFSYTQLRAFQSCPLQYKFAHVLKIPSPGKATFSFGKTMHSTLQRFFQRIKDQCAYKQPSLLGESQEGAKQNFVLKKQVSLDELFKIYESCWIDEWYGSKEEKEEYRAHGREILKTFYERLPEEIVPPKFLEKGFRFSINSSTIKGVMDRVDETGDDIEIIDYKTGGPKDLKSMEKYDKEQLLLYQMAYEAVSGNRPTLLTYYYLDNNKKVSFLGTDEELNKLKNDILQTIEGIQKKHYPPKPSFLCKNCDYYSICEYRMDRKG